MMRICQRIRKLGLGCLSGKMTNSSWVSDSAHGANTWSIPGGHREYGESWEECAKREVLEETGLEITNVRLLTVTNDLFENDQKHYITLWVESDWVSGKESVTEPDKLIQLAWRDFASLPSPLFDPCWKNLKKAKPKLFRSK